MLNNVTLVGRLTSDLELKEVNDRKVADITVAVPRSYKNANGEYDTDFIRCTIWGEIAANTAEYCHKGDVVGIRGSLQTDSYEDAEGNKKYVTKVNVDKLSFLSTKKVDEKEA